MNLVVDAGNTVLKAAVAEGFTLGKTYRYQGEKKMEFIHDLLRKHLPDTLVLCSAKDVTEDEIKLLSPAVRRLVVMDPSHTEVALSNSVPAFLTPDMVASVVAVRHLFKDKGCTVVDLGTTITTAFMAQDGSFAGSTISPGCTTRFRSISRYARNLPLLREVENVEAAGNTLETSIESGVVSGIMFEIEGYISMYPHNMVVFTGGDANYFAKRTKNSIFVVCNLVLMGLALIAEQE